MSKRQFKSQASSRRADSSAGISGFGTVFAGSSLSYLSEPPSLSTITDANVVVAFKNLSKKDSTTKAKGLEDLRLFILLHPYEQDGGVEQPILEAWVKLYPRLSIDNSRRVRELSHVLQYELLKSARKRMEKYLPSIVGSWLAGTYDRDRPVARAANDGITSFLDTEEKVLSFWQRCQPQILAYAQEAFKETPQSLSDERNMSSDDVQAKYDRLIGGSMSLVVNLLLKLEAHHIQKLQDAYTDFLSGNKTLWNFVAGNDAFLRRTTSQLLSICLDKQTQIIAEDLEIISHAFISRGLSSPQSSSSLQFLQSLNRLTQKFPVVWSNAYKGKKTPLERLQHFIEKGSQGSQSDYWQSLTSLIKTLPSDVIPRDLEGSVNLLKAYRQGISSKDEVRGNSLVAWHSYMETLQKLISELPSEDDSMLLLESAVFPSFEQYLRPKPELSNWSMRDNYSVLATAFEICYRAEQNTTQGSLEKEWLRLTELLITDMLISLPEQSKDYAKSQNSLLAESDRWFILQAEILRSPGLAKSLGEVIRFLAVPCSSTILKALEVLSVRNGKPYGAAGLLESALHQVPKLITAIPSTQDAIAYFLRTEFPKLLTSPSSTYLIESMYAFGMLAGREEPLDETWRTAAETLVCAPDSSQKTMAIKKLISNSKMNRLAQENINLQTYLLENIRKVVQGRIDDWSIYESSIKFDSLSKETASTAMSIIIDSLGQYDSALHALDFICRNRPALLRTEDGTYLAIMTNLLLLLESSDDSIVSRANILKEIVEKVDGSTSGSGIISFPILEIIKENLENVDEQSLSVDGLVQQANSILSSQPQIPPKAVLPDPDRWSEALIPFLKKKPNLELSLTNALGSAILLAQELGRVEVLELPRDIKGLSIAFRMALYTSKLLSKRSSSNFPVNYAIMTYRNLIYSYRIADEQFSSADQNQLWVNIGNHELQGLVSDFLDSERAALQIFSTGATSWREDEPDTTSAIVAQSLVNELIEASEGTSPKAFRAAHALHDIVLELVTVHGWKNLGGDEWLASLNIMKPSTTNIFAAVAVLSGLQELLASSKLVTNLCNRLVSDLTGISVNNDNTLKLLILLNATLAIFDPYNLPIAQNRVVFAVKHLTSWMGDTFDGSPFLAAEICRSLQLLFPFIKDVYGPYWEVSIKFCVGQWSMKSSNKATNELLPVYNSSLRLITLLRGLDEPNEDLSEALLDSAELFSYGILELLTVTPSKNSSPWIAFQSHLWRQALEIPNNHIKDLTTVYPLIASESHLTQSAAFLILSRVISKAQEQISLDVILEKREARIPEELLSLLLDAPASEEFTDEELETFPSRIRSYLYSWELVFIAYLKASYKVRNDYNEVLKSENYISPFLDFLFDILGHSAGQPLNLKAANFTSEHIRFYDDVVAQEEEGERQMQWLLINLYYWCLKYAPGLAKSWWMNCKSKQTRNAVESWTEKYFSPLVIEDAIDEVVAWAGKQEPDSEDEKELIIKVSKKSQEVYAGCAIDDTQLQIVLRLPGAYPLEGVKVDGVNRVAVTEKKWQSWLMITQGAITFSNGSIIDGLSIFRRNITGAMKGQTECAICYSIISSDKKLPEKQCPTCKNTFHTSCLFKWFASSNQNTCPLCRNPFNFGIGMAARAKQRLDSE